MKIAQMYAMLGHDIHMYGCVEYDVRLFLWM